jgi:beta-galactosidase GanA
MMLYGAQYYRPPFPHPSCWKRDLANMRKLGFNVVKFWAVWNGIERTPGKFYFDDLDELCDLASDHNLEIIINLIPEGAPYWTYDGDEENLYTTADGQRIRYGGPANIPSAGWPGRCMDDPSFSALVCNFIKQTAGHFYNRRAHQSIFAFDVWNEPHLEPMYDYRSNMLCYCKHSRAAFVRWLQDKYKTIEALNAAWYRQYNDWSQVEAPRRFGTWADMLDWRKFWLANLGRWLSLRTAACREGAPDIPVQTHVAYSGILGNRINGGLANELGDEFMLSKPVDIFGLSSFPKWLMGQEHYYRHLLHNEMIAQAARDKPFYQVELQGGGGKEGLLGGEVPTAEDIRIWNYNTAAAGGKGTIYWQYAPEPAGLESPGFGLTGFQGEASPRSESAGICAREIASRLPDDARRMAASNAVYVSRKTSLLCFAGERREELYAKSLSGFFKAAYAKGIPCRFFHEDQIDSLVQSGIKVLYLPMPLIITPEESRAFIDFIRQGGTLISEACPGLYGETGLLDQRSLMIKELFNVNHREVQGLPAGGAVEVEISPETSFQGLYYRQLVLPGEGTRTAGFFKDGNVAVTEYVRGKGKAVWIGTCPSAYFEISAHGPTGDYLAGLLDPGGYEIIASLTIEYEKHQPFPLAPVIRLLETDSTYILVMVNHNKAEARIDLRFTFPTEPVDRILKGRDCEIVSVHKVGYFVDGHYTEEHEMPRGKEKSVFP